MALSRTELQELSAISIDDEIPEAQVGAALQTPPFVPGPLLNLRDLGLVPGSSIRPNTIYRCGSLKSDPQTSEWLSEHVTKVFDLRHDREVHRSPDPQAENVTNVRCEMRGKGPRLDVKDFTGDGSEAWGKQYMIVLELYTPTLKAILEHVRDSCTPFLFHCTAGRDRTGVVAGMLHHLAGTPEEDIEYDYMLSRVGLEPARGMLVLAIKAGFSAEDVKSPGFHNVSSIRPSFWKAFQDNLREKYGGWDGFIRDSLGFNDADVEQMRENLRGK